MAITDIMQVGSLANTEFPFLQALENFGLRLSYLTTREAISPGSNDTSHAPPSLVPLLLGIVLTLMTLATIVVILRLYYNKTTSGVGLGWEDYSIVVAYVSHLSKDSFLDKN